MTAAEGAFSEIFGYTTVQMNKDFEIEKAIIQRAREEFGHSGLSVGLGLRTLGGFWVRSLRAGTRNRLSDVTHFKRLPGFS